jgi:hypothetical protein
LNRAGDGPRHATAQILDLEQPTGGYPMSV